MFGQVLDKVDTYFGRAFLLAQYVPWLLCVAANLAVACIEFPQLRAFIAKEYNDVAASKALDLAVAMLCVWVVAYCSAPVVQFITNFLEGEWIPHWLAVLLVSTHAQRRENLEKKYRTRFLRRSTMPATAEVIERLKSDRALGERLRAIGDLDAITVADGLVAELRAKRWLNREIALDEFFKTERALSKALRQNCAEPTLLLEPGDIEAARQLHWLHEEMWKTLAPYVLDIAQQLEDRAFGERQRLFAASELAPTRLGNDAAALRSYCETRYGIEFNVFWPRYLLVAQKDAKLSDAMAKEKIQLDFSILALTLTTISVVAWSVVLAVWGSSLWTVLLVLVLGPLATRVWLSIVHASYSSFADLARSAVDLYRFDLLTALHRPLPVTTDGEKKAWESVARLILLDEHRDNITFRHPTS
jgi:hypothetical protein